MIQLFLYFFTSSADLLSLPVFLFKIKLTHIVALLFSLWNLLLFRAFQIPFRFLLLALAISGCMLLSLYNSPSLLISACFIAFFLFNYLFYFLTSYNLFHFFSPALLFKIYRLSFYCMGSYACLQVLFAFIEIPLPGAHQLIFKFVRGQGLSYEPSYYALYMTSFAFFSTAKFLLEKPPVRSCRDLLWANLFLLVSTSTGCFFSYLFFLLLLFSLRPLIRAHFPHFSLKKLGFQTAITFLSLFTCLSLINKKLLIAGFLKFFYLGGIAHASFQDRWRGLIEYWNLFLSYPLTGVSFGGGPFRLVEARGLNPNHLLETDIMAGFAPMNVTTEMLASIGILGASAFLYFFSLLIATFRTTFRIALLTEEERTLFMAFALSLCILLITLQFNQSIMRPYVWIHIGLFCGYARFLKQKYEPVRVPYV